MACISEIPRGAYTYNQVDCGGLTRTTVGCQREALEVVALLQIYIQELSKCLFSRSLWCLLAFSESPKAAYMLILQSGEPVVALCVV